MIYWLFFVVLGAGIGARKYILMKKFLNVCWEGGKKGGQLSESTVSNPSVSFLVMLIFYHAIQVMDLPLEAVSDNQKKAEPDQSNDSKYEKKVKSESKRAAKSIRTNPSFR